MLDFNKLLNAIDATKTTKATREDDSHEYWKPTTDKAGNGSAVIRFLPDADVDQIPFVKVLSFGFKNEENNRWYIENSLQTIGQSDPANDLKSKWWNSKDLDESEFAKSMKRRTNYFSNILVIKDPANPENEGKVFKYRYGQKIFDKIISAAKPEFEDEAPINAWDPMNGADFRLSIKQVAGYANYDDSKFGPQKPLFAGDAGKIKAVLAECYDIQSLVAADKFKSYDELQKKLDWVLGRDERSDQSQTVSSRTVNAEREVDNFAEQTARTTQTRSTTPASAEDDPDLAFFQSLTQD